MAARWPTPGAAQTQRQPAPSLSSTAPQSPFESYFHRAIDRDQGLPETQVNAVAQSRDGYLWLGTRRGLVRYDGLHFRVFDRTTPGLPSEWINAVAADRRGRIWIGTTRGLALLDGESVRPVPTVPPREVWSVLEDRGGRIWVGTDSALMMASDGVFAVVPGSSGHRVYAIHEDPSGRIWFGGRGQFGIATARSARPLPDALDRIGTVYAIAPAAGDTAWIGTRRGIHRLITDSTGPPVIGPLVPTDTDGEFPVWGLATTPDGLVWAGTNGGGMMLWDGRRLTRFTTIQGLSARQILAIAVDSRGRVWAGTGAGLDRFQRTAFTSFGPSSGLPHESIWAVRGSGPTVWAAAFDGSVLEFTGQRFTPIVAGNGPASGSVPIWPSQRGGVWVAIGERDLVRIESGRRQARLAVPPSIGSVLGILEDRGSRLWLSTDSGVYRAGAGRIERWSDRLGLATGRGPRVMVEDDAGRLAFGGRTLTVLDGERVARFGAAEGLTDPDILALHPKGGFLWIGTADSGLYALHDDRVTRVGLVDRRLQQEALGIADDDRGNLWVTSSYGLVRVDLAQLERVAEGAPGPLEIQSFDRDDGLPTTEFNGDYQSALFKDPAGRLWLPSYAGVVRVDPERVEADSTPPQVWIEGLKIDGIPRSHRGPLALGPDVGRFEVTFAATDALVPGRVRLQYRMEGVDPTWIEAGTERTASYGPLEGGSYRFAVRAANEGGRWSEREAAVAFSVRFHLHELPFFWPAVIVILGLAAWAVNLFRIRRLHERQRQLSRLIDERTRDLAAARDHLERRVAERTRELADQLAERKRLEQQLVQSQKLEGIGRLAGGVAHEINNMMTGVLGFTSMAVASAQDRPDIVDDLEQVRRAGERAALITRQLLAFARRQQAQRGAVHLGDVLHDLDRFIHQMAGPDVRVIIDCPADLRPISADRSQVDQLVVNLVMNARDAMPRGGALTIKVTTTSLAEVTSIGGAELLPGDYLRLDVADTGVGMSAAVRARLFEPFFTTKEVNRGSGLGLAVCFGIVSQHGGAIAVESEIDRGTRFEIWLPVGVVVTEPSPAASAAADLPSGSETILIAEDEEAVRTVASRTLRSLGYVVHTAADGLAAFEVFGEHQAAVDLLLADLLMPGLTGPDLAARCRDRKPGLPVVFMSGLPPKGAAEVDGSNLGPLLSKPFSRHDLAQVVRRELDRARTSRTSGATIAQPDPRR